MYPIDLRSDTVTRPCSTMLKVMADAPVGDDCYGDDPSVNNLESYCAELFGKPAALFTASGTMSNQVALRAHTSPGDEVILDASYHIHYFESAPSSNLAQVSLNPCFSRDGVLTRELVQDAIGRKPRGEYYSNPKLVCIENTISAHGGKVFRLESMRKLRRFCEKGGLKIHLDGARLFNASVATGIPVREYAAEVHSVACCLSKGLGAPFGSVLVGEADFVSRARKFRKWYGGGFHQSGYMAAAALFALQNHIPYLINDHARAKNFARMLCDSGLYELDCESVETNFIIFDVSKLGVSPEVFVARAKEKGILLFPWTDGKVRATTHKDVDDTQIKCAGQLLIQLAQELKGKIVVHPRYVTKRRDNSIRIRSGKA